MGRYLNMLSAGGVENSFYKYTFGSQPSEVHLLEELPEIGDGLFVRVFMDESDGVPALFIDDAQEMSAYLYEWLAAYEMEDEFIPPDRAYGPKDKETYVAELPSYASEDFIDMVEAIAQQLSFTNGECFIWES